MFAVKAEPTIPEVCYNILENFPCEIDNNCNFKTYLKAALCNHQFIRHKKFATSIYDYQEVLKCYECPKCGSQTFSNLIFLHHTLNCEKTKKPEKTYWTRPRKPPRPKAPRKSTKNLEAKFKCDYCPYASKQNSNLKKHVEARHLPFDEINWLKCDDCSFITKRKTHLLAHRLYKHSPDPGALPLYQCDLCEYNSKFRECLSRHRKVVHGNEEVKWFCCELCQYRSKFKCALKRHLSSSKHPELKAGPFLKHSVFS